VRTFGEKDFLIWENQRFAYKAFDEIASRLANGFLKLGIKK
jgi:non-ribosomal peptide synthetase component E (peptide arylation enzyme)